MKRVTTHNKSEMHFQHCNEDIFLYMKAFLIYKRIYVILHNKFCKLNLTNIFKIRVRRRKDYIMGKEEWLQTSLGKREMKSRWNCGSMICIICRTCDASHKDIRSSSAIMRSALLQDWNISKILLSTIRKSTLKMYNSKWL